MSREAARGTVPGKAVPGKAGRALEADPGPGGGAEELWEQRPGAGGAGKAGTLKYCQAEEDRPQACLGGQGMASPELSCLVPLPTAPWGECPQGTLMCSCPGQEDHGLEVPMSK